ncbi:hypothetical protein ACFX2C_025843 [Malus domestica]
MGAAHILVPCLAVLISSFGAHGNIFSLERAFPRSHHMRHDELQARDRMRQAHLFKSKVVGGIANVSVVYDQRISGIRPTYQWYTRISTVLNISGCT